MSITRRLPQSVAARMIALQRAKTKRDSLPSGANFLTNQTSTRLDAIHAGYGSAVVAVNSATAVASQATVEKNEAKESCYLTTRHYLGNIMNAVERKESGFPRSILNYYEISPHNPKLPDMSNESLTLYVATLTVEGDAQRVTAGGPAGAFPSIAQVESARDLFTSKNSAHSNRSDDLDRAREHLDGLNTEADAVIKKVWDEVETFFNEETPESKRSSAREWGVVYVRTSDSSVTIIGTVRDSLSGEPIAAARILIIETNEETTTNTDGTYSLETVATGNITLQASKEGYTTHNHSMPAPDTGPFTHNINMVEAAP